MKSITIKSEAGFPIGHIKLEMGGKYAGTYQVRRLAAGNHRRHVKTVQQAWAWINKVTGGKAAPIPTGELLGFGEAA